METKRDSGAVPNHLHVAWTRVLLLGPNIGACRAQQGRESMLVGEGGEGNFVLALVVSVGEFCLIAFRLGTWEA